MYVAFDEVLRILRGWFLWVGSGVGEGPIEISVG